MKKGFTFLEVIIILVVLGAVLAILAPWISKKFPPSPTICLERPLKQFTVSQGGVSGSFFLGCGGINGGEKQYYFYYKTKEENKFRPAVAPLDKTIIIEDGQNKVVFIKKPFTKSLIEIDSDIDHGRFYSIEEFEFHIPKDSVLEAYDPNLSTSS